VGYSLLSLPEKSNNLAVGGLIKPSFYSTLIKLLGSQIPSIDLFSPGGLYEFLLWKMAIGVPTGFTFTPA
jgi:hypothetical protein